MRIDALHHLLARISRSFSTGPVRPRAAGVLALVAIGAGAAPVKASPIMVYDFDTRLSGDVSFGFRVGSVGAHDHLRYAIAAVFRPNGQIELFPGWNEVVMADACNGWVTLRRWDTQVDTLGNSYHRISRQQDIHLADLLDEPVGGYGGTHHVADLTTHESDPGDPGYGQPDGRVTLSDLTYFIENWLAGSEQAH